MNQPVGAIANGLEVMEEGKDEETSKFAMDLIKKSARTASAKLQFCRSPSAPRAPPAPRSTPATPKR
jgi:hypothetical protein